jgi:hypothetical protein
VTRPALARAAACLAAAVATVIGATLLSPPPAASAAPELRTPLRVTMDTISPSVIPSRGALVVTGRVTNRSEDTWTDLQAYLLTSSEPIGSSEELAAAAATEPTQDVGARLTDADLFAEIGDLGPGESTTYRLRVPRSRLQVSGAPGAYWLGVHVLGAVDGVRDPGAVADGRARSFIPLMPAATPRTRLALVVPIRDRVRRAPDNRLKGLARWQRMTGADGRLRRLLDFAGSSEAPLTWLVDPAVLDAVAAVAADNPPLATGDDGTGPQDEEGNEPEPDPSPSASGTTTDGATPDTESPSPPPVPDEEDLTPEALAAGDWLDRFRAESAGSSMMGLPYGDVDVAAVTDNRLDAILEEAERLTRVAAEALEVDLDPVVAPPAGYLPGRALARLPDDAPVLLSDRALPEAAGPVVTRQNGVRVALVDSSASSGGPGPNLRTDPLALRQRILAEAAVHALSPARDDPLLVTTPERWNPGDRWQESAFFSGLDVPWLERIDIPTALAGGGTGPVDRQRPVYPVGQRRTAIPFANQLATQELVEAGRVFAELLTANDSVADALGRTAMLGSSYPARARPGRALAATRAVTFRVRRDMAQVEVEGPGFVMMSSDTGPISVTVVNDLEDPVTVRLEAVTAGDGLRIEPADPITLGAGERAPVRMRADATSIGVHSVTLRATTESGTALGQSVRFTVRTSNVGFVIWLVMGVGGAVLLLAIVVRIVRRVRARRATHGPLLRGGS